MILWGALSSTECLTLIVTALFAYLSLRVLHARRKKKKLLPPGPSGCPIIGYGPFLTSIPEKKLRDLAYKYGDVMRLNLFGRDTIFLSSVDAIREGFVTQGHLFASRPNFVLSGIDNEEAKIRKLGIIESDGDAWKEHRRFAVQTLRDFGFGKLSQEARIQEIALDIVKELEASKGQPMEVEAILSNSSANVICSLLFDRHFRNDDPLFIRFTESFKKMLGNISLRKASFGYLIRFLPLQYLPSMKSFFEANKCLIEIVTELIVDHQNTFDPTFLRDYVDVYLDEMRKKEKSEENSTYTINRLKGISLDLLLTGTETTANTIHWALNILMARPDIQGKIHSEIDEIIGKDRWPSITDRANMPYMEATINEVLRFSSLVPFSACRSNPEEVKFRNFVIPEWSLILPNLWAMHHDPKYWPEPEKFDPTRFLSADGKLEKKDSFYPFSVGKRVCLGEQLARTEVFIFLSTIFQRFIILPPDGCTEMPLKIIHGILRQLEPYKLCARKRF